MVFPARGDRDRQGGAGWGSDSLDGPSATKAGDRVSGAAVVRALQITDDGELYRIANDDGTHGALKIARDGADGAARQISNELDATVD